MKKLTIYLIAIISLVATSCTKEHIKYEQLKGKRYKVFVTDDSPEVYHLLYYIKFNFDNTYTAIDYWRTLGDVKGFYLDGSNGDYIYLPCYDGGYCHPEKAILKDTTITFGSNPKVKVLKATFVDSGIEYYLKKDNSLPVNIGFGY